MSGLDANKAGSAIAAPLEPLEDMNTPRETFVVRAHLVGIERVEKNRFVVTLDGRRFASFCSESRARSAGRSEARRLDLVAHEAPGSRR
jgi:hypothetical protein